MKYLQILNYALLALAAAMAVVMAVVTLILAVYREQAAEIGGDFSAAVASTGAFAAFAAAAALACWAVRRRWPLWWLVQGGLFLVLAGIVLFLRQSN